MEMILNTILFSLVMGLSCHAFFTADARILFSAKHEKWHGFMDIFICLWFMHLDHQAV